MTVGNSITGEKNDFNSTYIFTFIFECISPWGYYRIQEWYLILQIFLIHSQKNWVCHRDFYPILHITKQMKCTFPTLYAIGTFYNVKEAWPIKHVNFKYSRATRFALKRNRSQLEAGYTTQDIQPPSAPYKLSTVIIFNNQHVEKNKNVLPMKCFIITP